MTDKFAAPAKALEEIAAHTKQTVEGFIKAGQEQAEKVNQQLFKGYDDLAAYNKQNVDALVASSTIAVKGAEQVGKAVAAYAQSSLEQGVATSKALFGVKSVKELFDLQTAYAKQSFDSFVSESTKLSELSVKVANEALAPINARVNATVGKMSKSAAA